MSEISYSGEDGTRTHDLLTASQALLLNKYNIVHCKTDT